MAYLFTIGLNVKIVWRKFFNSYFGFNRQQRNGLLALISIIFVLFIVRLNLHRFINPAKIEITNLTEIEEDLDSNFQQQQKFGAYSNKNVGFGKLFAFNPNTVNYEQLLKLGFKEKTAKTFLKFRAKGFVFKQKEDLKKIYGVNDYLYQRLEAYIVLNSTSQNLTNLNKTPISSKSKGGIVIDINSADSLTLLDVKGIGPSFAKRILKYRAMLGGFIFKKQLMEVYGFTPEMYNQIENQIEVKPISIEKINVNKDDFKTINNHPYLSYEHTKEIFNQRRKTLITTDLVRDILKDEELYNKLLPYLDFE